MVTLIKNLLLVAEETWKNFQDNCFIFKPNSGRQSLPVVKALIGLSWRKSVVAATQVELFNLKIFQNNSLGPESSSMLSYEEIFVLRKHAGSHKLF